MEIIGHRGAPREHPENTLEAFARALELGADGVELDVHRTADGSVVVHHDPAIRPASVGAPLEIAAASLDELRAVAAVAIPTLDEVMELVAPRATVYVEIKGVAAVDGVLGLCRRWPGRAAVHAFDHRVSRGVAERDAGIPVGILEVSRVVDPSGILRSAGARDLWQHCELLDRSLVDEVHGAGGRVIAWTVNDPRVAERFAEWGVDGVCTDVPGEMTRTIRGAR